MEWDLPQLRALAAAVDHGSLDGAAHALHVTPSAVSQRLKALERAAGAVLLTRARPVRATAAGEPVLRLARQIETLTAELDASSSVDGQDGARALPVVRLAVNADSLATWALPAVAGLVDRVRIEVVREDQDHTATLLRDGSVMAAITSEARPVQGCTVAPLGEMRYLPMASPALVERYFGGLGPHPDPEALAAALTRAPSIGFDAHDRLQAVVLERHGVRDTSPHHLVPASTQFAEAVRLGMGWGMLPEEHAAELPAGSVAPLPGVAPLDVPLYWQQWSLRTPSLDLVAHALRTAAGSALRSPVRGRPRP